MTKKMLHFLTWNSSVEVQDEGQPFRPFGINGVWEDPGVEMDYIATCLLGQAMTREGLLSQ